MDFINTNNEIVLIVDRPQTDFAKELGSRIYSKREEITMLVTNCFEERNENQIDAHYCYYDLWFYRKSGKNLFPIGALNSNCDLKDIGIGDGENKCTNMELFKRLGVNLLIDTLIGDLDISKRLKKDEACIFFKNGYKESPEYFKRYSRLNFIHNGINCLYNYHQFNAKDSLLINSGEDLNKQIKTYLSLKGLKQIEYMPINWHVNNNDINRLIDLENHDRVEICKVEIIFEFNREYITYFSNPFKQIKKKKAKKKSKLTPVYVLYKIPKT